jgi:hypothetical protein
MPSTFSWCAIRTAAGLDRMVAAAEDAGLYDLPDASFERLPVEGTEE